MANYQDIADELTFFDGIHVTFDNLESAEKALEEMEQEMLAIENALEKKMFDDAYTENAMIRELSRLEEDAAELALLIFHVKFDALH
jgi:hypothetical protein